MRRVVLAFLVAALCVVPAYADGEQLPEIPSDDVVEEVQGDDPAVDQGDPVETPQPSDDAAAVPPAAGLQPGDPDDVPGTDSPSGDQDDPVDGDADTVGDSGLADAAGVLDDIYTLMEDSELFTVADDYPSNAPFTGGYYISADTNLGDAVLYVPKEYQYGSFALDTSGNLVNLTAGTISGILKVGSRSYNLRISSFSTPEYREQSGSSWSWYDLTVRDIVSANVQIFEDGDAVRLWPTDTVLLLILILFGGVITWKQFTRL